MDYRIFPPEEIIETRVNLPLSKSESNRAIIMQALTPGTQALKRVAECDDTAAMLAAIDRREGEVNVGAAGTAMRFLTAYFAATQGVDVVLDGSERMRQRPIGPLVDALRSLGADIQYVGEEGFPPLHIVGRQLTGGEVAIDATISSQFVSALLMVAPTMSNGLVLRLDGEPSSLPYIMMTLKMMERRGIDYRRMPQAISVAPGVFKASDEAIEEDWSAASYWYQISAIGSGYVTLPGLRVDSLQGDSVCAKVYERVGIVTEPAEAEDGIEVMPSPDMYGRVDIDMSDMPDLAQGLIVTCATIGVPFQVSGLASLRIKETDRIAALKTELDKLGVSIVEEGNSLAWDGRRHPVFEMPVIDTYDDHRMAMAFAPVSLLVPGLVIKDIEVVSKSYPGFWDDLRAAGFTLVDASEPMESGGPDSPLMESPEHNQSMDPFVGA